MNNQKYKRLIYLDNAATSFPKPRSVILGACLGIKDYSGNPGRSSHTLSRRASGAVFALREAASSFFGTTGAERVIVTQSSTHSLNLALNALVNYSDGVLCSNIEHNAVRRVLLGLKRTRNVRIFKFDALKSDDDVLFQIENILKTERIRVVVTTHASNVCSRVLPLYEIGALCYRYGAFLVADCAQSAGHTEIHQEKLHADALCISGHKGLFSPAGIGLLTVSERFCDVASGKPVLITGGAGIDSLDEDMPLAFPERFEAGTQSAPLCLSLCRGIDFVKTQGILKIHKKELCLGKYAKMILLSKKGVRLYREDLEGPILSFNLEGYSPDELGAYFDRHGICLRTGLHCAPDAHACLGSLQEFGGSVRLSLGFFNTYRDLDAFGEVLFSLPSK